MKIEAAQETLAWKNKGFRSAKIKVGGNIEADRDIAGMARVRREANAVGLPIIAGQAWPA